MIQTNTAIEQVGRLYSNYNPTATQAARQEKVLLITSELKHITTDAFIKLCDLIMAESKNKSFPTIEDFKSRWHRIKNDTESDFVNHKFCDKCGQSGYYTVWQLTADIGVKKWYRFPYRCSCNSTTMLALSVIDPSCIPTEPHNPYPPNDDRHEIYRARQRI